MDELIRKQDVIKAICEDGTWLESQGCTEITMAERKQRDVDIIENLPTVQPKHGKWYIENNGFVVLDICDQCMRGVRHVAPFYDFCPHCGADMRCSENPNS